MNLKKIISGVSAFAIAASAFAAMTITAGAAVTPDGYGHTKYVWDFTDTSATMSDRLSTDANTKATLYYDAETSSYKNYVETANPKFTEMDDTTAGYGSAGTVAKIILQGTRKVDGGVPLGVSSSTSTYVELYAPISGTLTYTVETNITAQKNGTTTLSSGAVVTAGDRIKFYSSTGGRKVKSITIEETNYGIDESDTATYEGTSWTAKSATEDFKPTAKTRYAIATNENKAKVVESPLASGQLIAEIAANNTLTVGAKGSVSGVLTIRSGDTANYIAPEAGVVTVTFGSGSNGTVSVIKSATDGTVIGSAGASGTFTAYLEQGNRLKFQANTGSNTVHITSLTLDTNALRKSIASAGAVTQVNTEVITADENAVDTTTVAKAFTCTVSTGINGQFNTGDIKVKVSGKADQSPASNTVITNGSVLIGIIATASDSASLPEASAFTVTVE